MESDCETLKTKRRLVQKKGNAKWSHSQRNNETKFEKCCM